jgi:hypothetical protein
VSQDLSHEPDTDERRIRAHLRELVDGPAAEPPAMPPGPPPDGYQARERDWLDDILDNGPASASKPEHEPAPPEDWWAPLYQDDEADLDTFTGNTHASTTPPQPDRTPDTEDHDQDITDQAPAKAPKKPRPAAPEAPRQSLIEATARIPRRIRWLTYHASAAGAGWWLGWVDCIGRERHEVLRPGVEVVGRVQLDGGAVRHRRRLAGEAGQGPADDPARDDERSERRDRPHEPALERLRRLLGRRPQ